MADNKSTPLGGGSSTVKDDTAKKEDGPGKESEEEKKRQQVHARRPSQLDEFLRAHFSGKPKVVLFDNEDDTDTIDTCGATPYPSPTVPVKASERSHKRRLSRLDQIDFGVTSLDTTT